MSEYDKSLVFSTACGKDAPTATCVDWTNSGENMSSCRIAIA